MYWRLSKYVKKWLRNLPVSTNLYHSPIYLLLRLEAGYSMDRLELRLTGSMSFVRKKRKNKGDNRRGETL